MLAVKPNVGVHVNPIKANLNFRLIAGRGSSKSFPVPSRPAYNPPRGFLPSAEGHIKGPNPRGRIAPHPNRALARCFGDGRQVLNTPIVGNIELAPMGIIEANDLGASGIPAMEAPVPVKRLITPLSRKRRRVQMLRDNGRMLSLLMRTLSSK